MSKIQSGTYPINPEPFDAAALLDQSLDAVKAQAKDASVRLHADYPRTLEDLVGDRRALKQALVALLSNAVKFTPARGQVTLAAKPDGNALVVMVADTGIGISADDLTRVGEPFFQARGTIARPFEGAGLGVALVRGLVGLHGGSLAIESELGGGTKVTMKLPLDCRMLSVRGADAVVEVSDLRQPRQRPARHIKDAA